MNKKMTTKRKVVNVLLVALLIFSFFAVKYRMDENRAMKELNRYIMDCREVDRSINEVIKKINESHNEDYNYSEKEIEKDIEIMEDNYNAITTSNSDFEKLKEYYSESIDITRRILENLYENKYAYDGMKNVEERLVEIRESKREETMELLEEYKIKYKITDDGTLQYSLRIF